MCAHVYTTTIHRSSVWTPGRVAEKCDTEKQWSVGDVPVWPAPLRTGLPPVLHHRPASRSDIRNGLMTIFELAACVWLVSVCQCGHLTVELRSGSAPQSGNYKGSLAFLTLRLPLRTIPLYYSSHGGSSQLLRFSLAKKILKFQRQKRRKIFQLYLLLQVALE